MNALMDIQRNHASQAQIADHLRACEASFVPPLGQRVEIDAYATKLEAHAERFETWASGELIGLLAVYCNDPARRVAFITNVSVTPQWKGRGIAARVLLACIDHVRQAGFERIELEVDLQNSAATTLYMKHGFAVAATGERTQTLQLFV